MQWFLPFLLSLLPFSGFAQGRSKPVYVLQDHYQGQSFLDDWTFFTSPDPTHGMVNYLSKEAAIKNKLAVVQNGVTILAVDSTSEVPVGGNRNSVRINSVKTYTGGLFIADFKAMPYGCSIWPAYWSVGQATWPTGGEVDIVEGANNQPTNQYTLHTGLNCALPTASNASVTGKLRGTNCYSRPGHNNGCAFSDRNPTSYGAKFNANNGGVFAHVWTDDAITIWYFPRNSIPGDITAKAPDPSQWGPPAAYFPSTDCDLQSHFKNHSLVLDISLCGDWAGNTYQSDGCPGTCAEAVANNANFKHAKWEVNFISVYQT